jgi:glycosyltransferase involved in cell wall biosynthesis
MFEFSRREEGAASDELAVSVPFPSYVLVTPARNEEHQIVRTIECVVAQSVLPKRWVIVSDASTDRTDMIVEGFASKHSFIHLCRITEPHARSFARRIDVVNAGCKELEATPYDFIGSVDADVSFGSQYFEQLLRRFLTAPKLGLAAGSVRETSGYNLKPLRGDAFRYVANAAQLLRRACYEQIGGYPSLPYGGPDTYAEVAARMNGWRVETFYDLVVEHHRYTASVEGLLSGRVRQGQKDYSLGYHPLFEIVKCTRRLREPPAFLGAVARLAGYCWSYLRGEQPAVSREFVRFLRGEQRRRLRTAIGL